MARSRRHHPCVKVLNGGSDKPAKVQEHKRWRARLRGKMAHQEWDLVDYDRRDTPWNWPSDGKIWYGRRMDPRWMRK